MNGRYLISAICGGVGAVLSYFIGDFDGWMRLLLVAMVIDYLFGTFAAFKGKSVKSQNGGVSSVVGWVGLIKKLATLLLVGVTYQIEIASGSSGIRNVAVIGFATNEVLSIIENAAAIGIIIPAGLRDALEIFKNGGGENDTGRKKSGS